MYVYNYEVFTKKVLMKALADSVIGLVSKENAVTTYTDGSKSAERILLVAPPLVEN